MHIPQRRESVERDMFPVCGGLNRSGPHRLMYLNAWLIESGTLRRCGLVGVSVAFLGVVCHCGGRL